jgi:hypothetical protein
LATLDQAPGDALADIERRQFTQEYQESAEERFERFSAAVAAASRLVNLLDGFTRRLERPFSVRPV